MPILNVNITTGGTPQTVLSAGAGVINANLIATTEDGWLNFGSSVAFASTGVDTVTDLITANAPHNFSQGQAVTLTTAGVLPTGLSAATVYYVVVSTPTAFGLSTTYVNSQARTLINITGAGSGNSTVVVQAGVNVGIPFFLNTPLFLSSAEYPDITRAWSVYSATTNSKLTILYSTPNG